MLIPELLLDHLEHDQSARWRKAEELQVNIDVDLCCP
jgi:hypothetical protein